MFVHCVVMALMALAFQGSAPVTKDFTERAQHYWDLHKKMEGAAPKINKKKEEPAAIIEHEKKLRADIVAARAGAAEGDIFTPAVQKIIITAIQEALSSS